MTNKEIRNVTGIYDDDVLNAACECERKELLAERIANKIVKAHGFCEGLYNGDEFSFDKVMEVLRDFGFEYENPDDESECHVFFNEKSGDEILVYPVIYYPCQGEFRFWNCQLS